MSQARRTSSPAARPHGGRAPAALRVARRAALLAALVLAPSAGRSQTDGPPAFRGDLHVLRPRVAVVNYDPVLPWDGGARLSQNRGWVHASLRVPPHLQDFLDESHALLRPRVSSWAEIPFIPHLVDGFRYTEDDAATPGSWLYSWTRGGPWHQPETFDYTRALRELDLPRRVLAGEVTEVWMFGAPYFGGYETVMAGKGSFWVNGPAFGSVPSSRRFVIAMYNYERGLAEMMHDHGHRTESTLALAFGGWDPPGGWTDWDLFSRYDRIFPGGAVCGNIHFPPNGQSDYDYGNPLVVPSGAEDWLLNYPALTGATSPVASSDWDLGGDFHRGYLLWWFRHLPHAAGEKEGRINSWWPYVFGPDRWPETTAWPGQEWTFDPAGPGTGIDPSVRLTVNGEDDWHPQPDGAGRIVWQEWDGNDYEILSALEDGTGVVRITDNARDDTRPRAAADGTVAWQSFDGQDTEIWAARTDGSGLRQLTNDNREDRDPAVSTAGVAWWSTDGATSRVLGEAGGGGPIRTLSAPGAWALLPDLNSAGRVVYVALGPSTTEIHAVDLDGRNPAVLTVNGDPDEYPRISDSGDVVWMAGGTAAGWEIYRAPADGSSAPARLSSGSSWNLFPRISPAGTAVWMGFDGSDFEIWRQEAGGSAEQVTSNGGDDELPVPFGADGIAWQAWDGHDTEIEALASGIVRRITDNAWDDLAPAATAAGRLFWHALSGDGFTAEIHAAATTAVTARAISGTVTGDPAANPGTMLAPRPSLGTSGVARSAGDGTWRILVEDGWSGTIAPSRWGFGYSPPTRALSGVRADLPGQDFFATAFPPADWTLVEEGPLPWPSFGSAVSLASWGTEGSPLYALEGRGNDNGTSRTGNGFHRYDPASAAWTALASPPLERQTDASSGATIQSNLYQSMGAAILAPEDGRIWMVAHAADNHDFWGGNRDLLRFDPAAGPGGAWEVFDNGGPNTGQSGIAAVNRRVFANWQGWDGVSVFEAGSFPAGTAARSRALAPGGNLWPGALARAEGTTVWATHPVADFPAPLELYAFDGSSSAPVPRAVRGGALPPGWGAWSDGETIGGIAHVPATVSESCEPEIWVLRGKGSNELGIFRTASESWRIARLRDSSGDIPFGASDLEVAGRDVWFATSGGTRLWRVRLALPEDPDLLLRLTRDGDAVTVRWDSVAGKCYRLLRAEDPALARDLWTVVGTPVGGTGGPVSATDTPPPGRRLRSWLLSSAP